MLFLRCLLPICPVSFLSPVYLVLHFVLLFFFLCCLISCNPEIPVVVQACSIPSCIPMTPVVAQDCSTTGYIPATPSLLRIVASLAWTSNCHCTSSCRPQWLTMARAHFSPFTHRFHICIKTITISRYDQLSTTLLGFYLPFKKWTCTGKTCQSVCGNLLHSVFLGVTKVCSSIAILPAERFLCGSAGGKVLVSTCLACIYFERILLAGTAEQTGSLLLRFRRRQQSTLISLYASLIFLQPFKGFPFVTSFEHLDYHVSCWCWISISCAYS